MITKEKGKITCKAKLVFSGRNFEIWIPRSNCYISSEKSYSRSDIARRAARKIANRLGLVLDWKEKRNEKIIFTDRRRD
jgi:hypothetical protein